MSYECMCDDLEKARQNRAAVARDTGGAYWRHRELATQGWTLGEPPPRFLQVSDDPHTEANDYALVRRAVNGNIISPR